MTEYFYYELGKDGEQKNPSIGINNSGPIMSGTPQTYERARNNRRSSRSRSRSGSSNSPIPQAVVTPTPITQAIQNTPPKTKVDARVLTAINQQNNPNTRSTIKNYNTLSQPNQDVSFSLYGQYYQKQTGSFKAPDTKRDIPIVETRYMPGYIESKDKSEIKSRLIKKEERKDMSVHIASTEKEPSKIKQTYGIVQTKVIDEYRKISYGATTGLGKLGINETNIQKGSNFLLGKDVGPVVSTALIEAVTKPIDTAILFGASYVTGGASRVAGPVVKGATKFVGPKVSNILGKTTTGVIRTGAYGYGAYSVGKLGVDVLNSKNKLELQKTLGKGLYDISIGGLGFTKGEKDALKGYLKIKTRGRTEIPLPKVTNPDVITGKKTFVESGSYGFKNGGIKEKQLFDIKIFNKKPYSYHVTPSNYFDNKITNIAGTSEFKGLYTAPDASLYFAKLGKPSYTWLPKWEDLVSSDDPAIARVWGKVGVPKGLDRKNKEFIGKLEPGKAYVTGIKPEIEAVYPLVTPGFERINQKDYVKYKGYNIPIDDFQAMTKKGLEKNKDSISKDLSSYSSGSLQKINIPSRIKYSGRSSGSSYKPGGIYSPSYTNSYGSSGGSGSSGSSLSKSFKSLIGESYKSIGGSSKSLMTYKGSKPTYNTLITSNYLLSHKSSLSKYKNKYKTLDRDLRDAYKVILKKGKREKALPGLFTRGQALAVGENKTLSSLFARFKIEKTGFRIKDKSPFSYLVNPKLFRPYRIEKRKPIALIDEWIQRRSKRLTTPLEITEIQRYRRRK